MPDPVPESERFAGDPYFVKGGPADAPYGRADLRDPRWARRRTSETIGPTDPLLSSQAEADERYLADPGNLRGEEPILYRDKYGDLVVVDGHHRLLADRRAGRPTMATVYTDPAYEGAA